MGDRRFTRGGARITLLIGLVLASFSAAGTASAGQGYFAIATNSTGQTWTLKGAPRPYQNCWYPDDLGGTFTLNPLASTRAAYTENSGYIGYCLDNPHGHFIQWNQFAGSEAEDATQVPNMRPTLYQDYSGHPLNPLYRQGFLNPGGYIPGVKDPNTLKPGTEFYPVPDSSKFASGPPGVACWTSTSAGPGQRQIHLALKIDGGKQSNCGLTSRSSAPPVQFNGWSARDVHGGAVPTDMDVPSLFRPVEGPISTAPANPKVKTQPEPSNRTAIVPVSDTLLAACEYSFPSKQGRKNCQQGDDPNLGNYGIQGLEPVTVNISGLKLTPLVVPTTRNDVSQQSFPATPSGGNVIFSFNHTSGVQASTQTTKGTVFGQSASSSFTIGNKENFGLEKANTSFTFGVDISFQENFATTKATATSKSNSQGVSSTINAPPNTEVTAVATDSLTSSLPSFTANVYYGPSPFHRLQPPGGGITQAGNWQPHYSAWYQALGMSPTVEQYCIGTLGGDAGVAQSMMNIAAQVQQSGLNNPNVEPFLAAVAGFDGTGNTPPCDGGFPTHMRSAIAFAGSGQLQGSYESQAVQICAYFKYVPPGQSRRRRRTSAAPGHDTVCKKMPGGPGQPGGRLVQQRGGRWVDGRDTGRRKQVNGTGGPDLLTNTSGAQKTLNGGAGDDIIRGGSTGDRLLGGPGNDIILGGRGDDIIDGGPGNDALHGGPGNDTIVDNLGRNLLDGGPGNDTLVSGRRAQGVLEGGRGNDKLIAYGKAELAGGPGNDTYVVGHHAQVDILELPGGGNDTVTTSRSLALPPDVEHLRASNQGCPTRRRAGAAARRSVAHWSRPFRQFDPRAFQADMQPASDHGCDLALVGGFDTKTITGNRGDDLIVAGPGGERIKAGPGSDRIILSRYGRDDVWTGAGADTVVPDGYPVYQVRAPGLRNLKHRTGHIIEDFDQRAGDRILLKRSVFGPTLTRLRRHFRLVQGPHPRARRGQPTLMFNTRTKLLTYDPDGAGGVDDRVVVVLRRLRRLSRGAFIFGS